MAVKGNSGWGSEGGRDAVALPDIWKRWRGSGGGVTTNQDQLWVGGTEHRLCKLALQAMFAWGVPAPP